MPEIVDPITIGTPAGPHTTELEINAARRAFPIAQQLLAGGPVGTPAPYTLGWHDSSVDRESGSFAVVSFDPELEDLIGEVVQITFRHRVVYAYVLRAADVPVQLSVTRRVFLALNRLTLETLAVKAVPVA